MTGPSVLALSKWAHHSWFARGKRALGERAQATANADLLVRFPQLAAVRATPELPPFARLPRPAYAKVLRVAAALAHANSLCRIVSEADHEAFAARIAPNVLLGIQRDSRGKHDVARWSVAPDFLNRIDMTAIGLRIALQAYRDPAPFAMMQLRAPREVAQRMDGFGASVMSARVAAHLLESAYARARGEAC